MANRAEVLQEKLNILRRIYTMELPSKVDELERHLTLLREGGKDQECLAVLHRLTHNMVGSGSTFGFPVVSQKAGQLYSLLLSLAEGPLPPSEEQFRRITSCLADLRDVAAQDVSASIPSWCQWTPSLPELGLQKKKKRLVFLLEEDAASAKDLSVQMGYFGYAVKIFRDPVRMAQKMDEVRPDALIVDVGSKIHWRHGELEHGWDIRGGSPLPVIFTSARDDQESRLEAVRSGGCAYFSKPFDVSLLVDTLDSVTAPQGSDPYRVLIVEDEALEARHYSEILETAGMTAAVVGDPLQLLPQLIEFQPDLILMDLFMPNCNGMELAAMIRQQPEYVGIPIVFCSVEEDLSRQFKALLLGGDDFLTKPVPPERLISLIVSRARRGRTLRHHMIRDGLTGLLNHASIKNALNLEVARAQRHNGRFSYALIDIDELKSINDTYGHAAGDRVIKTIGRLLTQHRRKTDSVGRYGGDEFAVLLVEADPLSAKRILDEIRENFSKIRYQDLPRDFSASMSCGVASFPRYGDAETLHAISDKALYQAKARGGNRVVLANEVDVRSRSEGGRKSVKSGKSPFSGSSPRVILTS